jgi:diguanylate cyclase (GGDEF)-like protein
MSKKAETDKNEVVVKTFDQSPLAFPAHLDENKIIQELRDRVEKLKIFDSLGKTLTSSLDLSEILRLVVERFGALIESRHFGLLLIDAKTNEFYYQYPPDTDRIKKSFAMGRGILGKGLEYGFGSIVLDPSQSSDFDLEVDAHILHEASSLIQLPLISKGQVLGGVVFLTEKAQEPFTKDQFNLVRSFSDYLAIAIENASHHQRVQDLTITDDLTRLYNSRYLPIILEREIARCRRYQEAFSLIFIDLDNFKKVNDTYGHLAGSQILTEFGTFLYQQIRSSDIGIRYGGDEFVLALTKTAKKEALHFVERMIERLHQERFLKSRHLNIPMTASFGIASFPEDGQNIDELISAADRAMYHVKKSSKDGLFAAPSKVKIAD